MNGDTKNHAPDESTETVQSSSDGDPRIGVAGRELEEKVRKSLTALEQLTPEELNERRGRADDFLATVVSNLPALSAEEVNLLVPNLVERSVDLTSDFRNAWRSAALSHLIGKERIPIDLASGLLQKMVYLNLELKPLPEPMMIQLLDSIGSKYNCVEADFLSPLSAFGIHAYSQKVKSKFSALFMKTLAGLPKLKLGQSASMLVICSLWQSIEYYKRYFDTKFKIQPSQMAVFAASKELFQTLIRDGKVQHVSSARQSLIESFPSWQEGQGGVSFWSNALYHPVSIQSSKTKRILIIEESPKFLSAHRLPYLERNFLKFETARLQLFRLIHKDWSLTRVTLRQWTGQTLEEREEMWKELLGPDFHLEATRSQDSKTGPLEASGFYAAWDLLSQFPLLLSASRPLPELADHKGDHKNNEFDKYAGFKKQIHDLQAPLDWKSPTYQFLAGLDQYVSGHKEKARLSFEGAYATFLLRASKAATKALDKKKKNTYLDIVALLTLKGIGTEQSLEKAREYSSQINVDHNLLPIRSQSLFKYLELKARDPEAGDSKTLTTDSIWSAEEIADVAAVALKERDPALSSHLWALALEAQPEDSRFLRQAALVNSLAGHVERSAALGDRLLNVTANNPSLEDLSTAALYHSAIGSTERSLEIRQAILQNNSHTSNDVMSVIQDYRNQGDLKRPILLIRDLLSRQHSLDQRIYAANLLAVAGDYVAASTIWCDLTADAEEFEHILSLSSVELDEEILRTAIAATDLSLKHHCSVRLSKYLTSLGRYNKEGNVVQTAQDRVEMALFLLRSGDVTTGTKIWKNLESDPSAGFKTSQLNEAFLAFFALREYGMVVRIWNQLLQKKDFQSNADLEEKATYARWHFNFADQL